MVEAQREIDEQLSKNIFWRMHLNFSNFYFDFSMAGKLRFKLREIFWFEFQEFFCTLPRSVFPSSVKFVFNHES